MAEKEKAKRKPEAPKRAKEEKPEFSPTANYQWNVSDEFVLTGGEVDVLNKCLAAQAGTASDYQKFLWLQQGLNVMTNILKDAYTEGIIKQMPKEEAKKEELKAV